MFRIAIVTVSSLCLAVGFIYAAPKKYIIPFLEKRNILARKLTTSNEVCITIDDSPGKSFEKIVTIANKHEVNLSFFIIEENITISGHHLIKEEIKQDRHEFSNHGTTDSIAYFKSHQSLENEIDICDNRLVRMSAGLNRVPIGIKYYRPGGGLFHRSMLDLVKSKNKRVVLGSIYPWDAQLPSCFWPIHLLYIQWKLEPGDIIILHDKPGTIKLLDYLLTWLHVHNYQVKPLAKFMED